MGDHAKANQSEYQQLLKDNWLLLPDTFTQEDDGHVGTKWSSRHIPPQQTVYVECPGGFSSYADLQGICFGVWRKCSHLPHRKRTQESGKQNQNN